LELSKNCVMDITCSRYPQWHFMQILHVNRVTVYEGTVA